MSLLDATTLSKLSISELEQLYNQMPKPTPEQKEKSIKTDGYRHLRHPGQPHR